MHLVCFLEPAVFGFKTLSKKFTCASLSIDFKFIANCWAKSGELGFSTGL